MNIGLEFAVCLYCDNFNRTACIQIDALTGHIVLVLRQLKEPGCQRLNCPSSHMENLNGKYQMQINELTSMDREHFKN
jgi:hypothetical protein